MIKVLRKIALVKTSDGQPIVDAATYATIADVLEAERIKHTYTVESDDGTTTRVFLALSPQILINMDLNDNGWFIGCKVWLAAAAGECDAILTRGEDNGDTTLRRNAAAPAEGAKRAR